MKIDLLHDYNLRGAVLENAAKILLRRMHNNNFIFVCRYFDDVDEIINIIKGSPAGNGIPFHYDIPDIR